MKKLANEELILQFLIDKNKTSKTNAVAINPDDVAKLNLSEDEVIRSLYFLQTDGHLVIKNKSIHDDFSRFWQLELTSQGIHYFENKAERTREKRNNLIQFLMPLCISILALIVATLDYFKT